jgi:hypothetical protein
MLSVDTGPRLGTVETIATSGRGLNPEELVRLYLPKIIYVSPDLPELELKAEAPAIEKRRELPRLAAGAVSLPLTRFRAGAAAARKLQRYGMCSTTQARRTPRPRELCAEGRL